MYHCSESKDSYNLQEAGEGTLYEHKTLNVITSICTLKPMWHFRAGKPAKTFSITFSVLWIALSMKK